MRRGGNTVTKPANSPMLLASAASNTASSPASGDRTNHVNDRLTERRHIEQEMRSTSSRELSTRELNGAKVLKKTSKTCDKLVEDP